MSVETSAGQKDGMVEPRPQGLTAVIGLPIGLAACLIGCLLTFYFSIYSVHTDLAGILLSAQLADRLGNCQGVVTDRSAKASS